MNSYKMSYPKLQFSPLLIFLTLCLYLAISAGKILDHQDKQESKDTKTSLQENILKQYRNGYFTWLNFVTSINDTISSLEREIGVHKAEIEGLKSTIADQNFKFANLNGNITIQQGEIIEFNQAVRQLHKLNVSWEEFDDFIRGMQTEIKTGNSFGGATLPGIKSRVSQVGYRGFYTLVVFSNYLDEQIQDFTVYDNGKSMFNPAPNSIPPQTQEIFQFANPSYHWNEFSFSYAIPSVSVRIGVKSNNGADSVGLAFLPNDANMPTYLYDNQNGNGGSWVFESKPNLDKNLSVGYKNFHARMFADYEGEYKATLRIELIKLPID